MLTVAADAHQLEQSKWFTSGKVATPGLGAVILTVPAAELPAGLYWVQYVVAFSGAEQAAGRFSLRRNAGATTIGILGGNGSACFGSLLVRVNGSEDVTIQSEFAFTVSSIAASLIFTRIGG